MNESVRRVNVRSANSNRSQDWEHEPLEVRCGDESLLAYSSSARAAGSRLQEVEHERVDRVSDAFALELFSDQAPLSLESALAGDVSRRGKRFSLSGQLDELPMRRVLSIEEWDW